MAKKEYFDILKQGVEVWNRWRELHRSETLNFTRAHLSYAHLNYVHLSEADLSEANLHGADLSEALLRGAILYQANLSDADLSDAILRGADLSKANLRGTDLSGADLTYAILRGTDLRDRDFAGRDLRGTIFIRANLSGANLSDANLSGANLSDANLYDANLSGANLNGANLSGVILSGVNLISADLSDANLISADLSDANLTHANLAHADLSDADLSGANLSGQNLSGRNFAGRDLRSTIFISANLTQANLSGADLSYASLNNANLQNINLQTARLINVKLEGANLTEARLWETQRAGWSIKKIVCESVYWDKEAQIKTSYNPGDFERLFAEKTRVRLFFKDGITPLEIATLPALIKHLEETHPGSGLRLVSIHDDAGGAVVELAIVDDDQHSPEQMKQLQAALEIEAQQRIEYQRQALVERETRLQLEGEVRQLDSVVDKLIRHHTINIQPGGYMGDNIKIKGQVGAAGSHAHAHDMTFNQIVNHVEQNIDLVELTKQLSELRQAMAQKQDSPQAAVAIGEVAKAEIAATEKKTPKVIEHLKAAGKWTLDFAKDIGKDLVVDVIKKATGMP